MYTPLVRRFCVPLALAVPMVGCGGGSIDESPDDDVVTEPTPYIVEDEGEA